MHVIIILGIALLVIWLLIWLAFTIGSIVWTLLFVPAFVAGVIVVAAIMLYKGFFNGKIVTPLQDPPSRFARLRDPAWPGYVPVQLDTDLRRAFNTGMWMSLWALKWSFGMVGPGFGKGLIVGTFAVMGALIVLGPAAGFTMGGLAAVGFIMVALLVAAFPLRLGYWVAIKYWRLVLRRRVERTGTVLCPDPACFRRSEWPAFECPCRPHADEYRVHSHLRPGWQGLFRRVCECTKVHSVWAQKGEIPGVCPYCSEIMDAVSSDARHADLAMFGPPNSGRSEFLREGLEQLRDRLAQQSITEQVTHGDLAPPADATTRIVFIDTKQEVTADLTLIDPPGSTFTQSTDLDHLRIFEGNPRMLFVVNLWSVPEVQYALGQQDREAVKSMEETFGATIEGLRARSVPFEAKEFGVVVTGYRSLNAEQRQMLEEDAFPTDREHLGEYLSQRGLRVVLQTAALEMRAITWFLHGDRTEGAFTSASDVLLWAAGNDRHKTKILTETGVAGV